MLATRLVLCSSALVRSNRPVRCSSVRVLTTRLVRCCFVRMLTARPVRCSSVRVLPGRKPCFPRRDCAHRCGQHAGCSGPAYRNRIRRVSLRQDQESAVRHDGVERN